MAEKSFHPDDQTAQALARIETDNSAREIERVAVKAGCHHRAWKNILAITPAMDRLFAAKNQDDFQVENARVQGLLDELKVNCTSAGAHLE